MSEAHSQVNRTYGISANSTGPGQAPAFGSASYPPKQAAYPFPTQPYPLPVAVPARAVASSGFYGQGPGKKKKNSLLIAGIIILIIALIALVVALLFVFKPFGLFEDPLNVDPPTTEQVMAAFSKEEVEKGILSRFQYVDTEDMDEPVFSNTTVGNLAQNETGNKDVYCDATTDVVYQNDSLSAQTTLTTKFTYNKSTGEWVDSGVRPGDVKSEPLAGPDMEAIQENIISMLKSYDPSLGAKFSDSDVSTEASVGKDGGDAAFVLTTKAAEGETAQSCTVNTNIKWSESRGWVVEIKSIDGLPEEPSAEQPSASSSSSSSSSSSASSSASTVTPPPSSSAGSSGGGSGSGGSGNTGQPTMLLRCWSGDLVQVPGVIQFEGSHILLRTDDVIRVEFDNRVYITTYFELAGTANWVNGQHVTVIGEISASGTLGKAPLMINLNYD